MTTTPADSPAGASEPAPGRKNRGLRIFGWIVLIIVLLIIIAGIVLYMNLNRIVRTTVQKQSSNSLNLPTQLQSASVSLLSGQVSLHDFEVGSPQGFNAPHMMTLGGVSVDTSLGELRSDPMRVSSIAINNPKLVIEMQGMNFNIKKFMDSLPAGEDKPTPEGEKPLKLIIDDLKVNGAQVVFRPDSAALSAIPGLDKAELKSEYVLSIPPLEMKSIGTGEGNQNGAAVKEVVTLLVTQLASKAAQSDQLPPEIRSVLSMNVDQMAEMAKAKIGAEVNKQIDKISTELGKKLPGQAGEALQGVLKNPQAAATNPAGAIEQGLGGLLGGKNKKAPATQPHP
jgi:uncharacterized protein involved in outer membrane biogenesis